MEEVEPITILKVIQTNIIFVKLQAQDQLQDIILGNKLNHFTLTTFRIIS